MEYMRWMFERHLDTGGPKEAVSVGPNFVGRPKQRTDIDSLKSRL